MYSTEMVANVFSWYRGIVPTKRLTEEQVKDADKIIASFGLETFANIIGFDLKASAPVKVETGGISISADGYAIIQQFEGFRANAYLDTGGVWTIGYGTIKYPNGNAVRKGDTCTKTDASAWMKTDCVWVIACMTKKITTKNLTQNQYDALASFIYNVGETQFSTSTLLNLLNRGNIQGAASQFKRWVYDNGKRIDGLAVRREKEKALFLS